MIIHLKETFFSSEAFEHRGSGGRCRAEAPEMTRSECSVRLKPSGQNRLEDLPSVTGISQQSGQLTTWSLCSTNQKYLTVCTELPGSSLMAALYIILILNFWRVQASRTDQILNLSYFLVIWFRLDIFVTAVMFLLLHSRRHVMAGWWLG